jgi:hypothetical protein
MKRSLWVCSTAVVLAIALVAPVSASGKLNLSACATSSGALQITLAWKGIAATSHGYGVYDVIGGQLTGAGDTTAKPLHRSVWTSVAEVESSTAASVVGGVWDSKANVEISRTVSAPWSPCP